MIKLTVEFQNTQHADMGIDQPGFTGPFYCRPQFIQAIAPIYDDNEDEIGSLIYINGDTIAVKEGVEKVLDLL